MKLYSLSDNDLNSIVNVSPKISKSYLTLPGENYFKFLDSKPKKVKDNLMLVFNSGNLAKTGYLSILPFDHGIEHGAIVSFKDNLNLFDPEYIAKLAIEGGCNALVSTYGILKFCSKYADKIPLVLKVNHNDILSNLKNRQSFYSDVDQAIDIGAIGIAATLYFGSNDTFEQVEKIAAVFKEANKKGLFTILWSYLRNDNLVQDKDYHYAADITAQANYVASTIGADIIKQKFPKMPNGFKVIKKSLDVGSYGDHPVDMVRLQVLNCLGGKVGLMNSGGAVSANDERDLLYGAAVNKVAGGLGMMVGRKVFVKPFDEAVKLLHSVQNLYLSKDVKII